MVVVWLALISSYKKITEGGVYHHHHHHMEETEAGASQLVTA